MFIQHIGKCRVHFSYGAHIERKVLTNVYLECRSVVLQIVIAYERGSFLWLGSDSDGPRSVPRAKERSFGDVPRAMSRTKLQKIVASRGNNNNNITDFYYIPADLDQFLFDYEHSSFIECNRQMAAKTRARMGNEYVNKPQRLKMLAGVADYLSETLSVTFRKHYWLAGGTLLGWYRECSIIPHTADVDLAVWSHEYETRIKEYFLGNTVVRVWGSLGMVSRWQHPQ